MPGIGDVAWRQHALPAGLFDEPLRVPGVVVFIEISDQKVRTLSRESQSDGPADSRVAACQQHLLVAQAAGTPIAVLAVIWMGIHQGRRAGNRLSLRGK